MNSNPVRRYPHRWPDAFNFRAASLSQLLVWCFLCGLHAQSQAFEKYRCTESWYKQSISASVRRSPDTIRECEPFPSHTLELGWYAVIQGKAYWHIVDEERHSPCSGGGAGALGHLIDPVCYVPRKLQFHQNDSYHQFWLVSGDGQHFHLASTNKKDLMPWQRASVMRYAVDSTFVYWNSEKMEGADPALFEVIFPFGDDPRWEKYSVARDQNHIYIDGWPIPTIDLDKVGWMDVRCEGPDTRCKETGYAAASIGKVGDDILFLRYGYRPTVFKGLASSDLSCFRRDFSQYCYTSGKRYLIEPDLEQEAKLIPETPMDK